MEVKLHFEYLECELVESDGYQLDASRIELLGVWLG